MTSRSSIFNKASIWWASCFCLGLMACQSAPEGFVALDELVSKKLIAFGAGDRSIAQSEYVLMQWEVMDSANDSVEIVHEALIEVKRLADIVLNNTIRMDVQSLEDGAMVEYMAPGQSFQGIDDTHSLHHKLIIQHCFRDRNEAAHFLATSASEGLRSEAECMDLFTALYPDLQWHAFDDMWVGFKTKSEGDSVKVDRNVTIQYHTYLLGGQCLDSLTSMEFQFGKSGQLLPAMQWGLAKMREGESALILTASQWAFGQEGRSVGRIPPHTPLYWDVHVVNVD